MCDSSMRDTLEALTRIIQGFDYGVEADDFRDLLGAAHALAADAGLDLHRHDVQGLKKRPGDVDGVGLQAVERGVQRELGCPTLDN